MKISYVIAALGLVGCAAEQDIAVEESAATLDLPTDDNAIPVGSVEIARVQMFYGDLVYFAPAEEETADGTSAGTSVASIAMLELSRADSTGLVRALARDGSPLESFLIATASTIPVPRRLLDSEASEAVRQRALQRPIVEALSAPVSGLPASQLGANVSAVGNISQMCTGTTSASFASEVCTLDNWDVDFCHNGTWHSVTDSVGSSNKRRDSRSRTLACGANGRVRHYYKLGGIWYKPIDEAVPSSSLSKWTKYGNWALQRAITHSRTASGFVRGASHFNIPF